MTTRIDPNFMLEVKRNGFSDQQIAILTNKNEHEVRESRKSLNIIPVVKQIDTLAAEYPAHTNYLYLTYSGIESDIEFYSDEIDIAGERYPAKASLRPMYDPKNERVRS